MKHRKLFQTPTIKSGLALAALGALMVPATLQAQDRGDHDQSDEAKIQRGLAIAPVLLDLTGKDWALVGLGSYLVNAVADCNGCHSAGPQSEYQSGGNPYWGQHPTKVNAATYLGGGRDFGPYPTNGPFPHVVSRNLTPDKNGLPAGHTFAEFVMILRTGKDFDQVHPTCSGAPDGTCLPAPFDGDLLQIMPWPAFQTLTYYDLLTIYSYLSAVPCLEGDPGVPAPPGPPQSRCH